MEEQTLLDRLRSKTQTLSGQPMYVEETNPQNDIRSRAPQLSLRVCDELEADGIPNDVLINGLAVLQREYHDTKHYGDIRSRPGDEITTQDILDILQPLWRRVPETAKLLQGRIENILDAAKAKGAAQRREPSPLAGTPRPAPT